MTGEQRWRMPNTEARSLHGMSISESSTYQLMARVLPVDQLLEKIAYLSFAVLLISVWLDRLPGFVSDVGDMYWITLRTAGNLKQPNITGLYNTYPDEAFFRWLFLNYS